jgi:hypothetical protein
MGQSGTVALKSFQSFQVNEGLLTKVVEATKAGEKEARSTGDVQSFEVFYKGFRQNIAIGRLYIIPAKIADKLEGFPIALLYGCLVKEFGGEEVSDLITHRIGDNEFDEYSQADMSTIKDKLFKTPDGKFESIVLFAPHWFNKREYVVFKFDKDDEKLRTKLRHLVFGAYYDPRLSSAFDALMTDVSTDKLDVTDITPKLPFPELSQNPLRAYPVLNKLGSADKPKIFLSVKTADAVTKETLAPEEISVFDALGMAVEKALGVKTPQEAGEEHHEEGSQKVPRLAAKKDHFCECSDHACPAHRGSNECHQITKEKLCAECQKTKKSSKEACEAPHGVPAGTTNVGPGTEAADAKKNKEVSEVKFNEEAAKAHESEQEPIGIELNSDGTPKRAAVKTADSDYFRELRALGFKRTSRSAPFTYEKEVGGDRRIDVQIEGHLQGGRVCHWHTTGPKFFKNNPAMVDAIKQRGGNPVDYGWIQDTYPSGFNSVEGMKQAIEYQMTATKDSPRKSFFDPKAPGGYGIHESSNLSDISVKTAGVSDGQIRFANKTQVWLWTCELEGQISDGMWENSGPRDHWQEVCGADVIVGEPGLTNIYPRRSYGFRRLVEYVGDRMLVTGKLSKAYPELTPSQTLSSAAEYLTDGLLEKPGATFKAIENQFTSWQEAEIQKLEQATGDDRATIVQKLQAAPYGKQDLMRDLRAIENVINGGYRSVKGSLIKQAKDRNEFYDYKGHQFHLTTWEERDRFNIRLMDECCDKEVLDVWDEDAAGLIEDGFIDPRNMAESTVQYVDSIGLLNDIINKEVTADVDDNAEYQIQASSAWKGETIERFVAASQHSQDKRAKHEAMLQKKYGDRRKFADDVPSNDDILNEVLQDMGQAPLVEVPNDENNKQPKPGGGIGALPESAKSDTPEKERSISDSQAQAVPAALENSATKHEEPKQQESKQQESQEPKPEESKVEESKSEESKSESEEPKTAAKFTPHSFVDGKCEYCGEKWSVQGANKSCPKGKKEKSKAAGGHRDGCECKFCSPRGSPEGFNEEEWEKQKKEREGKKEESKTASALDLSAKAADLLQFIGDIAINLDDYGITDWRNFDYSMEGGNADPLVLNELQKKNYLDQNGYLTEKAFVNMSGFEDLAKNASSKTARKMGKCKECGKDRSLDDEGLCHQCWQKIEDDKKEEATVKTADCYQCGCNKGVGGERCPKCGHYHRKESSAREKVASYIKNASITVEEGEDGEGFHMLVIMNGREYVLRGPDAEQFQKDYANIQKPAGAVNALVEKYMDKLRPYKKPAEVGKGEPNIPGWLKEKELQEKSSSEIEKKAWVVCEACGGSGMQNGRVCRACDGTGHESKKIGKVARECNAQDLTTCPEGVKCLNCGAVSSSNLKIEHVPQSKQTASIKTALLKGCTRCHKLKVPVERITSLCDGCVKELQLEDEKVAGDKKGGGPGNCPVCGSRNTVWINSKGGRAAKCNNCGNVGLVDKFGSMQKVAYVKHCPGHRNSDGNLAEWCVYSHETGKILSSHTTEDKAKKHLQDMHAHSGSTKTAAFWNKKSPELPEDKLANAKFFYCETVTAGGASPWHIREKGPKGVMLGGGADTPALCGRTVAWDLRVPIDIESESGKAQLRAACRKCAVEYLKLMSTNPEWYERKGSKKTAKDSGNCPVCKCELTKDGGCPRASTHPKTAEEHENSGFQTSYCSKCRRETKHAIRGNEKQCTTCSTLGTIPKKTATGTLVLPGNLESPESGNVNAMREALETQQEMEVGKSIGEKENELEQVQNAAKDHGVETDVHVPGVGKVEEVTVPKAEGNAGTQVIINIASASKIPITNDGSTGADGGTDIDGHTPMISAIQEKEADGYEHQTTIGNCKECRRERPVPYFGYCQECWDKKQDAPNDPPGYAKRVRELEAEGMTTSDAQAVADVEFAKKEAKTAKDRKERNMEPFFKKEKKSSNQWKDEKGQTWEKCSYCNGKDNPNCVKCNGKGYYKVPAEKKAGFNFFFPGQALREFYPELQHELVDYPNDTNSPMIEDIDISQGYDSDIAEAADESLDTTKLSYVSTSPAAGAGIGRDGKPEVLEGAPLRKENDIRGMMFTDEFHQQYTPGPDGSALAIVSKKVAASDEPKQFSKFLKKVCGEIAAALVSAFKVTSRPLMDKVPGMGEVQLAQVEKAQPGFMPVDATVVDPASRVKYLLDKLNDGEIQNAINDAWAQSAVWNKEQDGGFVYEVFVRAESIDTDTMVMKYKFVVGTREAQGA